MYHITLFKNRFDNQTDKFIDLIDWERFVKFLYGLNESIYEKKEDAPLISSAVYKEGTTRANNNVVEWSPWCALDVDGLNCTVEEAKKIIFDRFGKWDFVCHSTGSCEENKAKCRVIIRLKRPVLNKEIKSFWFGINTAVGNLGDKQTKDFSRMFYVPGKVGENFNFMFHNITSIPIDVDSILKEYPYIEKTGNSFLDLLPEGIRKQVIEERKKGLNNTETNWTNYRNCKYFPKRLAKEYQAITDTGWYHMMYRIMVAIACNAIKDNYPITVAQITELCKEFDIDNGGWYTKRPIHLEAASALNYAYSKTITMG